MNENIELKLVGITYNQIESGVYALVLEDVEEGRRLAIVIGYPEAQSIECHLQKVKTPRPLSHDLMAKILETMGGKLLRVDIHRLPSGPYAGKLTVENFFGDRLEIDARSSDAIALAIRVGAPIFTSRQLIEKEGFIPKNDNVVKTVRLKPTPKAKVNKLETFSKEKLEELLAKYVAEENYEQAALVKQELDRRNNPED